MSFTARSLGWTPLAADWWRGFTVEPLMEFLTVLPEKCLPANQWRLYGSVTCGVFKTMTARALGWTPLATDWWSGFTVEPLVGFSTVPPEKSLAADRWRLYGSVTCEVFKSIT